MHYTSKHGIEQSRAASAEGTCSTGVHHTGQSCPTSKKPSRTVEGTAKKADDRPSVREELREIKAARQETAEKPAALSKEQPVKKPQQKITQHKQPVNRKKKHKSR